MRMLTRHRVPVTEQPAWMSAAETALNALAACPGFAGGEIEAAVDDPELMVITSRWESVGSYRRALSDFNVKANAVPLLYGAIDEPTAFEVLRDHDGTAMTSHTSARAADADSVAVRDAAGPDIAPRSH